MERPIWFDAFMRDLNGRFMGHLNDWFKEAYFIKGMGGGMYGLGIAETISYVEKHQKEIEEMI